DCLVPYINYFDFVPAAIPTETLIV
ncbi:hypothetical protein LCGC14_2843370, partial [marine sediment metagenome]